MITLFENNISRTFEGSASHNENTYSYFNRSARKDVAIVRDKLEEWFYEFPSEEKKELKSRFIKKFDSSFYELFIFQLFKHLGFSICIHPDIPGTNNKPDFLVKKGNIEIYIEAKISKDKSSKEEAFENRLNRFYDEINKTNTGAFLLNINKLTFKTEKQPKTRSLIKYIESELGKLDPKVVTAEFEKNGFRNIHGIKFENDEIHLVIEPLPLKDPSKNIKDRQAIGMYPSVSFTGGAEESIKDSISRKAKRYGKLDKPFLVCVNALSKKTTSGSDIENAIWGSLALVFSNDPGIHIERWIRKSDGVFLDKKGPRLKNLSGALITRVFPFNIPYANYWLFRHPFSENQLDFSELGLKYSVIKNGVFETVIGDDFDGILEIDKNWMVE